MHKVDFLRIYDGVAEIALVSGMSNVVALIGHMPVIIIGDFLVRYEVDYGADTKKAAGYQVQKTEQVLACHKPLHTSQAQETEQSGQ